MPGAEESRDSGTIRLLRWLAVGGRTGSSRIHVSVQLRYSAVVLRCRSSGRVASLPVIAPTKTRQILMGPGPDCSQETHRTQPSNRQRIVSSGFCPVVTLLLEVTLSSSLIHL